MKLKALKRIRYGGKAVLAGEVFDAKPADVRILLAVKHAENCVEPVVSKPAARALEPQKPSSPPADSVPVFTEVTVDSTDDKPKRFYKRRDMSAE